MQMQEAAKNLSHIEKIIIGFADLAWGTPLLVLLLGGGVFFLVYSRLMPLRYFRHAVQILMGRYDNPTEEGQINHYQALSTAHGTAKTNEPVREGLVAMLGPIVDTIIVCTMTALALIITGVWNSGESDGITLTADAYQTAIPGVGAYLLTICVTIFAISTMLSFPYYGTKCFSFIFGARHSYLCKWFYIISIVVSATISLGVVISITDGAYAMMAFPTMISALLLSPAVVRASRDYFRRLNDNRGRSTHHKKQ